MQSNVYNVIVTWFGWHNLAAAAGLTRPLFVVYGSTCLMRLIEFAALFKTVEAILR